MSLRYWLNKRVDCERSTTTKDAAGGDVTSFATFTYDADSGATTASLRARDIQKRHNDKDTAFARADGLSEIEWVFEVDWGARPGDRIKYGSVYYEVVGVAFDFGHDAISFATPYVVKTHRRQTTT